MASALHSQSTVTTDVIESARAPVLAALANAVNAPIVALTARSDRAKQLTDELRVWSRAPGSIYLFAEPDPLFYEHMPWNTETIAARLAALAALA
ncbi:MAG: hypothetical protein M1482_05895, partial [Chloroflexi bacterium]|nr:hypothetical protein [Chloroflexota bacterium]